MATTDVGLQDAVGRAARVPLVNNLSIQVATVNGSGSQSSNTVHHPREQRWIRRPQKRN